MLLAVPYLSSKGVLAHTYKLSEDTFIFPDDMLSYLIRKQGLKLILAKDAYCFHYGSITLKDEGQDREYFIKGQMDFLKAFGIDPWGKGFCYDLELFKKLDIQQKHNANILGISPGMGSNPLKVKTLLREYESENIKLFLISEDEEFRIDYETYTEPNLIEITPVSEFISVFPEETFDYIFVETHVGNDEIHAFRKRLRTDGILLVWYSESEAEKLHKKIKPSEIIRSGLFKAGLWYIFKK